MQVQRALMCARRSAATRATTRAVPMREIGSGENHVGYHTVAHVALRTWFASRNRPEPSFLPLDRAVADAGAAIFKA